MDDLIIHKYRNFWLLTSQAQVEGGLTLDAPPVRIIPHKDKDQLRAVLLELFAEEVPIVPSPDFNDPKQLLGIRAEALGLNSWRTFVKHARAFYLQKMKDSLVIEEWPREKWSFVADPIWKKNFAPDELDKLVDYLIRKTSHDRESDKSAAKKGRQ